MFPECKDFLRDLYLCTMDSEPSQKLEELLSHKWFSKHSVVIPPNHISIGLQSWHNLQHDIIRRAARIGGCREKEITTAVLENSLNSAAALYHILIKSTEKASGLRQRDKRSTTQSNDNGKTSTVSHRRICYSKDTIGSFKKNSTLQRKACLPRLLGKVSYSKQCLVPAIHKPISQEQNSEEHKTNQETSTQNSIITAKYMTGGGNKALKSIRRDNPDTSKDDIILNRQDQKVFIHMWNGMIPPKTPPPAPPNSASHDVKQPQDNEERNFKIKQPRHGHWRTSFKKKQALKSLTTNGKKILRYRIL